MNILRPQETQVRSSSADHKPIWHLLIGGYGVRASLDRAGRNNRQKPRAMNSEIVYWLDALNGIGNSPDLHFGVLIKNTQVGVYAKDSYDFNDDPVSCNRATWDSQPLGSRNP